MPSVNCKERGTVIVRRKEENWKEFVGIYKAENGYIYSK